MYEKNGLLLLATLGLLLDFSILVNPMQSFAQSRVAKSREADKRTGVEVDATKLSNLGPMHRDSFGRASTTKAKQRGWWQREDGILKGQRRHDSEKTLKIFYKANKSVKPKHLPSGNSRGRSFNAQKRHWLENSGDHKSNNSDFKVSVRPSPPLTSDSLVDEYFLRPANGSDAPKEHGLDDETSEASQDEQPTLLKEKNCKGATHGDESCVDIKEQFKKQRILNEMTENNKNKYTIDSNVDEAEVSGIDLGSGETSAEGISNDLADAFVDRQSSHHGNVNELLADDESRVSEVSSMDDLNADDYDERTVVPVGSIIDHTPDRMTEALARNVGNSITDRVQERSYLVKGDTEDSPESSSEGESADTASGARFESLSRSRVPVLMNTVSEYIGDTQNDGDADATSTATSGDFSTAAAYDDGDYDGELLISKSRSTYNESQANSTSNQIRLKRSHVQSERRRVSRSSPNDLRLVMEKLASHSKRSRHLRPALMRKFNNYKRDRLEENSTRINDSKARNPEDEAELLRLLKNIETSKSAKSVSKNIEDQPFRRYLKKLAEDVRSVVSQAKDVLHDTGKVVHGLRKVISRGSVMTSFAENSVKDGRMVLGLNNSTLNYLEEQAVVALLDAQRASSDAKVAAEIARKAAKKAVLLTQRAKATSKDKSSSSTSSNFAKEVEILADKAEKEAKDASMEENKVEASVLLMDKKLKELTSAKSLKQSALPGVTLASANIVKSNSSKSKSNKPNAIADDAWAKELSDILSGIKLESQTSKKAKNVRKKKAKTGKAEKLKNRNVSLGHHVNSLKAASEPTVGSEGKGSSFNKGNTTEVSPQLAISGHQSEVKSSELQEKQNLGNESVDSNPHDDRKLNNDHDEKEWQSTEERLSEAVTLLIDQIKKRKAKSKYNGRHVSKGRPAGQGLRGEHEPEDQEGKEAGPEEAGTLEASRAAATQRIEDESFKHFLAKQKELEEALTGQLSVNKASKNQAHKDVKQVGEESPQESGSPHELAPVHSSDQSRSQEDGTGIQGEATNPKASYLDGSEVASNSEQYGENLDKYSASFSQATTNASETLRHSPKISLDKVQPMLDFKPKGSSVKNQSKSMDGPLTMLASQGDEALSTGTELPASDQPSDAAQTNTIYSSSSVDTMSGSPSRPGSVILKAMDEAIRASNGTSHDHRNENSYGEERSTSFGDDDSRSIDQKIKLIERQELEAKKKLADIHLARKIAISPRVSSAKVLHFSDHASNQTANEDPVLGAGFTGKLSKANKRRKKLAGKERKEQIKNFLKEHKDHALKIGATLLHRSPDHVKKFNLHGLTTKQPFDEVQLALTIAKERPNGKTELMPLVARKSITKDRSQVAVGSLTSRELPGLEESKVIPDGSKRVAELPMSPEKDVDVLARKKTLQTSANSGKDSENKENYKNIIGEELLLKSHIFKPPDARPVISPIDQDHRTLFSRAYNREHSVSYQNSPNAISEAQDPSMFEERTFYDRHVTDLRNSKLLHRARLAGQAIGDNRGINEKRFKPRTRKPYVQILKDVPDLDFDKASTSLIPKQYHTEEAVERKVEKGPVSVTVHVNRNVPNKQEHVGGERRRVLGASFTLDSPKSDDNLRSLDSIDPFGFAQMDVNGSTDAKRSSLPGREPPMRQKMDRQDHFSKHSRDSHIATSDARDIKKVLGFADYRRSSIPTQSDLQNLQQRWNSREFENARSNAMPVVANFPAFVDERE